MAESYTKAKLVAELAGATSLSKAAVGRLLDRLTEIAYREAVNGFVVPGLCKLKVVKKKASRRRNPITGQVFMIGERIGLKVVPLKKAKMAIVPNKDVVVQLIEEAPVEVQVVEEAPAVPSAPGQATPGAAPAASPMLAGGEDGQIVFPCPECASMLAAPPKMPWQTGECRFCRAGTVIRNRQPDDTKPQKQVLGGGGSGSVSDFILFICRACGQEIEAPADMVGMNVECPTCTTSLTVPISGAGDRASDTQKIDPESGGAKVNRSSMTIRIDLSDLE